MSSESLENIKTWQSFYNIQVNECVIQLENVIKIHHLKTLTQKNTGINIRCIFKYPET